MALLRTGFMSMEKVTVVGGGLAGCEAAWALARKGFNVRLLEQRPKHRTEAHKTGDLAELVCSNSFKSFGQQSAASQLKEEMLQLGSVVIESAVKARVPAGQALSVDRQKFSEYLSKKLIDSGKVERVDQRLEKVPSRQELEKNNEWWILATGPLTDASLAESIAPEDEQRYFYDAIAPIISADSIDMEHCFFQSRYQPESDDYLNIPLEKPEYLQLIEQIINAQYTELHDFENTKYFESCLPIEVMAGRGVDTLRFGPMKPAGLTDPKTNRRPYACIQLRKENVHASIFSMVGFQTKMKWPEQKRVFSMLPALREAEFLRYGSVHRNTYFNGPKLLNSDLSLRSNPRVFLAGQITGVEGYSESSAIGILAGLFLASKSRGLDFKAPPPGSVIGSLHSYVTKGPLGEYQPMNANLGLLPPIESRKKIPKRERKAMLCEAAQREFAQYMSLEVH